MKKIKKPTKKVTPLPKILPGEPTVVRTPKDLSSISKPYVKR